MQKTYKLHGNLVFIDNRISIIDTTTNNNIYINSNILKSSINNKYI